MFFCCYENEECLKLRQYSKPKSGFLQWFQTPGLAVFLLIDENMSRLLLTNVSVVALLISLTAQAQTYSSSNDSNDCVECATHAVPANPPIQKPASDTIHTALGSLRVQVEGQGQTMVAKPGVIDITNHLYAVLTNPKNSKYPEVLMDFDTAANLMSLITAPVSSSGTGGGLQSQLGVGGPIHINPGPTSPATYEQLGTLLGQNSTISTNSKYFLLSMVEGKLGDQWTNEKYRTATLDQTLTQEFTAIKNNSAPAGLCGPIHTMGAFVAKSLGLGDVGMIGTDWKQDGAQTVAHAIAFSKDPKTKKYVFTNYSDLSKTQSLSLSVAALQQAHNLSPYTSSLDVETDTISANPHEHLIEPQLAKNLTGAIAKTNDPNAPNIDVNIGTLHSEVAYQHKIVGSDKNKLIGFGVLQDNRQVPADPVQVGAAGVGGTLEYDKSHGVINTSVKGNLEVGTFFAHDQTPPGDNAVKENTRTVSGYIATTDEQANLAWNTSKLKGQVGVDAQAKEVFYGFGKGIQVGAPFSKLSVSGSVDVTPNVKVHGDADFFAYTRSLSDQAITIHNGQESVGVDVHKDFDHGKVSVSNGTDGYLFNSAAFGVRDQGTVTFQGNHGLSYTAYGETSVCINHSNDEYDTDPAHGLIGVKIDKQLSRVDLEGRYAQAITQAKLPESMSSGAFAPTLADTQSSTFGLTLRFKPKDNSIQ